MKRALHRSSKKPSYERALRVLATANVIVACACAGLSFAASAISKSEGYALCGVAWAALALALWKLGTR